MRYQISEIRLLPEEYGDVENRISYIEKKIFKKLRGSLKASGSKDSGRDMSIRNIEILKESIDARKKPDVRAVYTVAFETDMKLPLKEAPEKQIKGPEETVLWKNRDSRPVIAGFGPCGIFAALLLAMAGARPIIIERGKPVSDRIRDVERFWKEGILDPESNVQFGEGGAGTFSDGKLTTGVKDPRIKWILAQFVSAGADPDILYKNRPHIGTDRLREVIPAIRERIISLGGEIRFGTRLDDLETRAGTLKAVKTSGGIIESDVLILATGHSAEDTFRMLKDKGVEMRPKPFSIGVRVEHLQEDIDRAQYGDPGFADIFGPADYKLSHRCENGRGVYTFCMCPGGRVINSASGPFEGVTNGMSDRARDGEYANSGLLVDVRVDDLGDGDDPLRGIAFQKKYEKMAWEAAEREPDRDRITSDGLPWSNYGSFRSDPEDRVRSCIPGFASESIIEAMPHLGKKLRGFDSDDTRLTAVETRSSSPLRIERDKSLQSSIRGLIPAGEGPGYAGGIISAALDGIRAAEAAAEYVNMIDREDRSIGDQRKHV